MSLRRLTTSLLCAAALGAGLRAQDTPPAPAEGAPVELAYRYRTGNAQRFRGNVNTNLTMAQDGGPFGPIPIDVKALLSFTEKVTGTSQGTGTLSVSLDSLLLKVNAAILELDLKLLNGKLTASAGGQPVPLEGEGPGAMLKSLVPTKPALVRRNPRGVTVPTDAAAASTNALLGGVLLGSAVQLPDHPVQVGASWESRQRVQMAAPGPLGGGAPLPEIELQLTSSLKSVETMGGRRIAVIETTGAGTSAAPEGQAPAASQDVTSTARFDIERGALVALTSKVSMRMNTGAPPGAVKLAALSQLPSSGQLDGTVEIKLEEAPLVPANKPAAAKPSAKGPVRKPVRKR